MMSGERLFFIEIQQPYFRWVMISSLLNYLAEAVSRHWFPDLKQFQIMHSGALLRLHKYSWTSFQNSAPPLAVLEPVVDRSMVQHIDAELCLDALPCETTLEGLLFPLVISSDLEFMSSNSSWFHVFMVVIANLWGFSLFFFGPLNPFWVSNEHHLYLILLRKQVSSVCSDFWQKKMVHDHFNL